MSTILVDNLTGKTSAGDITVTSEGGAATQSLQQGLCKVWINFNGTGTIATRDSFNVSSISDEGGGLYQYDFSNAMSNANYSGSGMVGEGNNNNNRNMQFGDTYSTTALDLNCGDGVGSTVDPSVVCSQIFGDLA
jgi:hypothetical protein